MDTRTVQTLIDQSNDASPERQLDSLIHAADLQERHEAAMAAHDAEKRATKAAAEKAAIEQWNIEAREHLASVMAAEDAAFKRANLAGWERKNRLIAFCGTADLQTALCRLLDRVTALEAERTR